MKQTTRIWIAMLALFTATIGISLQAQTPRGGNGGEARREEIRTMKIAFFTEALSLTPQESEKFWPIYNQYWNDLRETGHKRRELIKTIKEGKAGEKELKEWLSIMAAEQKITSDYAEKFKAVLPLNKVLKVFVTDEEFKNYLIRQATAGRGGGGR